MKLTKTYLLVPPIELRSLGIGKDESLEQVAFDDKSLEQVAPTVLFCYRHIQSRAEP